MKAAVMSKILKRRKTLGFLLAATLALGAATTAQAARNWTGNENSNWATSGNWNGTSGRRYFKKGNLTGSKRDFIYLSADVTETSNTGLCFYDVPDRGYWRFQGQGQYTFDNSTTTKTSSASATTGITLPPVSMR